MKAWHRRVIGGLALVVGLALLTIWTGTMIAVASERGVAQLVKEAYYDWPGNVAQFTLWALSALFTIGGVFLLVRKKVSPKPACQSPPPEKSN